MAVLRIAKMGNPVLLQKAAPVADPTAPEIRQLAADMQETLEDIGASGLAAPHGPALDSKNDLYVSEVTWTFAVSRGRAPADCHTFQKFALKA